MVVLGDFNIAPDDRDVHDPAQWQDKILCSDADSDALKHLISMGLHDSFRLHHADVGPFRLWVYRAPGLRRDPGLRIFMDLVSAVVHLRSLGPAFNLAATTV